MKRRDFLLLRPDRRARVFELACGRLYMRYLEALALVPRDAAEPLSGADPGDGEPPLEIDTPSVEALFAGLADELQSADVVRLVNPQWLADPAFKALIDDSLEAFRARGGQIQGSEGSKGSEGS